MEHKTFLESVSSGRYVILKKGSRIYRANTDSFDIQDDRAILRRNIINLDSSNYFGVDSQTISSNYGITSGVDVNQDIALLNMSNLETRRSLENSMKSLDSVALKALNRSFPIEDNQVRRDSTSKNDHIVLEFICNFTEFGGYYQPEIMKTKSEGGKMHSEIAICHKAVNSLTQYLGTQAQPLPAGSGLTYRGLMEEATLRKLEKERLARRQAAALSRRRSQDRQDQMPSAKRLNFD
jgi:hypothetical protein